WNNVNLMLSTASPVLSASGPGLAPFHVTLTTEAQANAQTSAPRSGPGKAQSVGNLFGRGLSKDQVQEQLAGLNSQRSQSVKAAHNSVIFDEQNKLNWNVNTAAYGLQQLEINGDATTLSVLRSEKSDEANGPSLSYQLSGAVTLASRSDQQMVRILQTDMDSKF